MLHPFSLLKVEFEVEFVEDAGDKQVVFVESAVVPDGHDVTHVPLLTM